MNRTIEELDQEIENWKAQIANIEPMYCVLSDIHLNYLMVERYRLAHPHLYRIRQYSAKLLKRLVNQLRVDSLD